jgi:glycosyltransferase involved in cell wall biosynthesis
MQGTHLGGTEHAAIRAMRYLAGVGAEFRVTSPRPRGGSWPEIEAIDPSARAFPCRGRGLFGKIDLGQFAAFRRHVGQLEASTEATWISGSSVTSLLACRTRRRRAVMSHHYYHFGDRASWPKWKLFYEGLCRHLEAVTYPTEFTRAEALRIAPWLRSRAVVVPNGYELHYTGEAERRVVQRAARERLGLPADAFIVGNGGWLNANKRYDVFLETAARVAARLNESCFVICGGGPAEGDLQRLAADLGIAGRTHFTGWVADMDPYYQAFDVLLFNSDKDTLPCAPMEAASLGCTVVASLRYGGLGEFLKDGHNSFFFGDHDPDRLAEAVCELAENPSLAERLRREAAADLAQRFSIEKCAAFFREFFGLRGAS